MTNQRAEDVIKILSRLTENRKKPTQCHLWRKDHLAREDLYCLTFVKKYLDDSHLSRSLSRCKLCDQLYFREFYEEIDWEKGDDKQYSTHIPVESESEADEISELSPFELLCFDPMIKDDSHNTMGIHWSGK